MCVIVGVAFFVWRARTPEALTIDLVERFPDAEKRTTMPSLHEGFDIMDVTIDGETKRSIFAHPHSRIIWTVDLPEDATLETAVALRPHTYLLSGDGAQFRIGVSDGERYDELYKRTVNPGQVPEDRHWFPVRIDLSKWSGRQVQVIFNTDPGPSGNAVHDASVWGMPRIVRRAGTS